MSPDTSDSHTPEPRDGADTRTAEELIATLETWAAAAPPPPDVTALAAAGRAHRRRTGLRRATATLAVAATVAAVATGVHLAARPDGRESPAAGAGARLGDCGPVPAARSDGPPAVELRVVPPGRALSGTRIRVQVQARSLDGKAHQLTTGPHPSLDWVRDGRVVGRDDGPQLSIALMQPVPADGSWTTLRWYGETTEPSETVGGCTTETDNAPRRRPLPPGRYDLVVTVRSGGPFGGQEAVYVSAPASVEVVAPDPDTPARLDVATSFSPDVVVPGGSLLVDSLETDGTTERVRSVPLDADRLTLTLPAGAYRLSWSENSSCATHLALSPGETTWTTVECPQGTVVTP